MNTLRYNQAFNTETGSVLPGIEIAYDTWGDLNESGDNVIWVCHALTANSDVESWWPGMLGKGLLFDTEKYFIVCANVLGSCYGSTGPASINPETGKPWLRDFPEITVRDLVNAHDILRKHLRINKIHTIIGASIGGFQSLEYCLMHPGLIDHLVFISSSARQSPWAIAFSESQRLAMQADQTFLAGDPEGGKRGLRAARALALLSYRNAAAYNKTQAEDDDSKTHSFKASSYQDYQGDKLVKRYNPYSYYCIVNLSDSHNVGRNRGGVVKALAEVKARTLCIGFSSDLLFPVEEQKYVAQHVQGAQYIEVDSFYGHDGFLIESELLTKVIRNFWNCFPISSSLPGPENLLNGARLKQVTDKFKTYEMTHKKLRIGLFGYGCVGQGLHDVLNSSKGFKADIVKICVKSRNKKRRLGMEYFTFDKSEILDDPSINLVVELIDDADEAYSIVTTAMKKGKNVVSANKMMIATHFRELVELQEQYNVSLLYEASAGASIPIIRNLEEYYDNELLYSLRGILNGTTNYILTRMYCSDLSYSGALMEAQEKGFAESDPTLDVEGWDAKYKLCIITGHAYGLFLNPDAVFHYGIKNISEFDIRYAREKGYKIKLVSYVGKTNDNTITGFVLPRFISGDKYLFNVDYEYNGVITEAAFADKQFFSGKGAGGHPTGSAVLSDISANSYGYKYEYKKFRQGTITNYTRNHKIEIYLRYKDEKDRDLFAFDEVSEYFCGRFYKYTIGVVNLDTLYNLKEYLSTADVFLVNTGRKINPQ